MQYNDEAIAGQVIIMQGNWAPTPFRYGTQGIRHFADYQTTVWPVFLIVLCFVEGCNDWIERKALGDRGSINLVVSIWLCQFGCSYLNCLIAKILVKEIFLRQFFTVFMASFLDWEHTSENKWTTYFTGEHTRNCLLLAPYLLLHLSLRCRCVLRSEHSHLHCL